MRSKTLALRLGALLFWLLVWEAAARWLDLSFALPTATATWEALTRLCVTRAFWHTIAMSLLRIFEGLCLGVLLGVALAALCVKSKIMNALISPVQTVIRCTPVASFIMLLWLLIGRDAVPGAIALLMVAPVIWQGVCSGYRALDPALGEVLRAFRAPLRQRLLLHVLPGLRPALFSSLATAAGLAWKAGIAAEMIAYTSSSIGREIANARSLFSGADMMAWTVCVVVLSLLLERLLALAARKGGGNP